MMNAKVLATWHAEQRDALADAIKRFDSGELDNGIMFSIRAEQHDFHKRAAVLIDRLSAEVEALRADAEHDAKGAEMSADAMRTALEQLSFVFVNEGETAAEALRRVRDVARAALAQPASELAHGTINNGQGN